MSDSMMGCDGVRGAGPEGGDRQSGHGSDGPGNEGYGPPRDRGSEFGVELSLGSEVGTESEDGPDRGDGCGDGNSAAHRDGSSFACGDGDGSARGGGSDFERGDQGGFGGGDRRAQGPQASMAAGVGLVEVCASLSLLCGIGAAALVAHTQAIVALRESIEFRQATWILDAMAESLRSGQKVQSVQREWALHAQAVLRDAFVEIVEVSDLALEIEVSWRAERRMSDWGCAAGWSCLRTAVAIQTESLGVP